MDDSFSRDGLQSIAKILVDLDCCRGLHESIDLIRYCHHYTWVLDYINIPFRFYGCHQYGNIVK